MAQRVSDETLQEIQEQYPHARVTAVYICEDCGALIWRCRGDGDLECDCGALYNGFGQRVRFEITDSDIPPDGFDPLDAGEEW